MPTPTILKGICIDSAKEGGFVFVAIVILCLLIGWALGHDWKVSKKFERKIKKQWGE